MSIVNRLKDTFAFGRAVGEYLEEQHISEEEERTGETLDCAIQYAADESEVNITGGVESIVYRIAVGYGRAKRF
jgi:hypothetical protein